MFTVPARADHLYSVTESESETSNQDEMATKIKPTAVESAKRARDERLADNEEELAGYLIENPAFFLRHADVLAEARVADPHGGRAISLHERQLEVLRQQNDSVREELETLMRTARENEVITDRLTQWTRQLLLVRASTDMPARVVDGLQRIFRVPCVALRLWDVDAGILEAAGKDAACFEAVDDNTRRMTNDLKNPYCGLRGDIAQARWLDDGGVNIRSVALLSLRSGISPNAFGLIVLGSPDADRFQNGMGTEFLERIAQTASAALARLTASGDQPAQAS
ncbi:MAG: DUF484 family protein [Burkholderiaceae bacterium]